MPSSSALPHPQEDTARRIGDCRVFLWRDERFSEDREIEYRGWGRLAREDDPASALTTADMEGWTTERGVKVRGMLEEWSLGTRASEHLRLAVAAAQRGTLAPGKPIPGCACTDCVPAKATARAIPPTPRAPLPPLDVEGARAVPALAVALALGIEGLRRSGRTYRGPCPLHGGDGPHFSVSPQESWYRCHVCGEGGDGIRLARVVRGLSFPDAVNFVLEAG